VKRRVYLAWLGVRGTSTGGRRRCDQDLLLFLALARDLVHEHSKEDDDTRGRWIWHQIDSTLADLWPSMIL
jgi:hypothetical protein